MRRTIAGVMLISLLAVAGPLPAQVPILDPRRGVMTMAPLLDAVTPAVVSVSVRVRAPVQENPLLRDPFFRRFFDLPPGRQPERRAMSAGSGVVVDAARGYILTNHHVVDNADEITVTLKDRRELVAKLVGSDPETDIALLEVKASGLDALSLADSDQLRVGDIVFAIGNPFGLGQTVTTGIVSALGRGIGMHGYEDFIQTDAAINPGNSGGALVNSKGELIGINTAIIGPTGGNVGIGFAVPANMASSVMGQLVRHGEVRRGRIGVLVQDLTPDLAEALGIRERGGAVVSRIEDRSPAERAGLKPGDVIVEVDSHPVRDAGDLRNRVGLVERGRRVAIGYVRDGSRRDATLEVGEPERAAFSGGRDAPQLAGSQFTELPADHPAHGKVAGVLAAAVEPGSPAWRAGLREGDIVLAVNRRAVESVADLQHAVQRAERVLALNLLRGSTYLLLIIQ